MALYADENVPLRVIEELRRLDHDVLTAFEDGKANQSIRDPDILTRATELGRAIVTLNRLDFKRLHLKMPQHAGIVICTEGSGSHRSSPANYRRNYRSGRLEIQIDPSISSKVNSGD